MALNTTPSLCPGCNHPYTPGSVYCGNCGHQVKAVDDKTTIQLQHDTPTRLPYPSTQPFATLPDTPKQSFWTPRKIVVLTATILLLLIFVGSGLFFFAYQLGRNSASASTSHTTSPTTATVSTVATATSPSTLTSPSPTPSPTPTPCSSPCVLYQENGSDNWAGWSYPDGWRVVGNGILLGGETSTMPAAVAPHTLPVGITNFAIEVVIAVPQGVDQSSGAGFGITACGSSTPNGWQGYTGGIVTGFLHLNGNIDEGASVNRPDGQIGTGTFDPGVTFHTFRLEIKGNDLTLKINGAPVIVDAKDQEYLQCGPQVGIWDSAAHVIQIQSFTVIAL